MGATEGRFSNAKGTAATFLCCVLLEAGTIFSPRFDQGLINGALQAVLHCGAMARLSAYLTG